MSGLAKGMTCSSLFLSRSVSLCLWVSPSPQPCPYCPQWPHCCLGPPPLRILRDRTDAPVGPPAPSLLSSLKPPTQDSLGLSGAKGYVDWMNLRPKLKIVGLLEHFPRFIQEFGKTHKKDCNGNTAPLMIVMTLIRTVHFTCTLPKMYS